MASCVDSGDVLVHDEPLAPLTTLGIGGPARLFYSPRTVDELAAVLAELDARGERVRFLGNGSNLLVDDDGVDGAVVSFRRLRFVEARADEPGVFDVGAGAMVPALIARTARSGFAGMERLVGIPGSIGGSLFQNAGGRDGSMADIVDGATLVTRSGRIVFRRQDELGLGYRKSALGGAAVASVRLRLAPDDPRVVVERARAAMRYRKRTQPLQDRSPGCIFVNPHGERSASWLLERAGVKGLRHGRASFSEKHSNFIINEGGATAHDVRALIREARERVFDRFHQRLRLEITEWTAGRPIG